MTTGRPPGWNPFASLDPGVWTEVVEFGSKGRFGIPAAARRRLTWLAGAAAQGLLATLEDGGVARLEPWSVAGDATVKAVAAAIDAAPARRSEIALAATDRFMHVSVEENGRIVVPSNLVVHLDPHVTGRARVVVRDDRMWLWSQVGWEEARTARLSVLLAAIPS